MTHRPEPAAPAFLAGWRRRRRVTHELKDFDQWEAMVDSRVALPWWDADLSTVFPPPDYVDRVDLAAGEFFRHTWRRRLVESEGNCGYVARQMRKAGVPLDLALVILLTPGSWFEEGMSYEQVPAAVHERETVDQSMQRLLAEAA